MEAFLEDWLARVTAADLGFMCNRVARELSGIALRNENTDLVLVAGLADKMARKPSEITDALSALESAGLIGVIEGRPNCCSLT